jgi:hypothetical protein
MTCPVCGFRHSLSKFKMEMNAIEYPLARVTGGGRGKGFRVQEYLPWSTLPSLRQTETWNNLLGLYSRLASAYDNFFNVLGFLSPGIRKLLNERYQPYSYVYQANPLPDYADAYDAAVLIVDR